MVKRAIWMATISLVVSAMSVALYAGGQNKTKKQVTLREQELQVLRFDSDKDVYWVGDPIRLFVELNKTAYVYIFNVDPATGKTYMVFPNKYAQRNRIKAKSLLVIPPENALWEITASSSGYEQFLLLASTKKQNFRISAPSKDAIFGEMDRKELNTKLLIFRRRSSSSRSSKSEAVTASKVVVVQKAEYVPTNFNNYYPIRPEVGPIVVLNVSPLRNFYYIGDSVTVVYGSTYDGYIYLVMVYPNRQEGQQYELVYEDKVKGGKLKSNTFYVTNPPGVQYLVAVYSPTQIHSKSKYAKAYKAMRLTDFSFLSQSEIKGLSLNRQSPKPDSYENPSFYQAVKLNVMERRF